MLRHMAERAGATLTRQTPRRRRQRVPLAHRQPQGGALRGGRSLL